MAKSRNAGSRGSRSRRGKGEDFTGAKEGSVEMKTAAPEFALPAPDDYQHHKKQILGFLEKKDTAHSLYRKALQTAQKAGIDTDALMRAHRLTKQNDPTAAKREFEQFAFALKQEGFQIQIVVHDTLAGDVNKQAYERGLGDAKNGKMASNPYPQGSDLFGQYSKGFRHGTADNAGVAREAVDDEEDDPGLTQIAREIGTPQQGAAH